MFLNPLWPAYGEALTRKDYSWIKRAFKRSLWMSFSLSLAGSVLLVIFSPAILNLWVGPAVQSDFPLLVGLGLWTVILSVGTAVAMLLNGASIVRFQLIMASVMAIAAIISKTLMASYIGVAGIVWGTLLAYIVTSGIPLTVYVSRLLKRME